jgi:hypothetical protein
MRGNTGFRSGKTRRYTRTPSKSFRAAKSTCPLPIERGAGCHSGALRIECIALTLTA